MNKERLVALFEAHANTEAIFVTSDGMPFFDRAAAALHAATKADKAVQVANRSELFAPEVLAEELEEITPPTGTPAADSTQATTAPKPVADSSAAATPDPAIDATADPVAPKAGSEPINPLLDFTVAEVKAWADVQTDVATLQTAVDLKYTTLKGGQAAIVARIANLNPTV